MRLAISTTETLTDLKTDLVVANNNNNMVRVGGMGWLKPVAIVLLMLCSAVFGFEPVLCCDVWYVLCYVRKNHLLERLR